jgi:L-seryl-tRNA(Ser) seleniumtransferase
VESVALQHLDTHAADAVWDPPSDLVDVDRYDGVPRQGIGRPMKVGKEEIAGLLRALELFVEEDHDARREEWHTRAERIADALSAAPALSTRTTADGETSVAPEVRVEVDEEAAGRSTADLVLSLRREDPRVFVGADALDDRVFTVSPMCLDDEETNYVVERIRAAL